MGSPTSPAPKPLYSRSDALVVARSWIGTPYVLGARIKGAGCDCATLLVEYLIEIGATTDAEIGSLGIYSGDWFMHTSNERYLKGLMKFGKLAAATFCRPGVKAKPGDLALFKVAHSPVFNHGAIITEWPKAIHAAGDGVKEVDLTAEALTAYREMEVFSPFGDSE